MPSGEARRPSPATAHLQGVLRGGRVRRGWVKADGCPPATGRGVAAPPAPKGGKRGRSPPARRLPTCTPEGPTTPEGCMWAVCIHLPTAPGTDWQAASGGNARRAGGARGAPLYRLPLQRLTASGRHGRASAAESPRERAQRALALESEGGNSGAKFKSVES